jgi:hypothetical protein
MWIFCGYCEIYGDGLYPVSDDATDCPCCMRSVDDKGVIKSPLSDDGMDRARAKARAEMYSEVDI